MTYRIDPKTRRIIVSDLTPAHKNKTTGVHGVAEIMSKKEFDDYKREKEEKEELAGLTAAYNAIMENEPHDSDRRGFEIR